VLGRCSGEGWGRTGSLFFGAKRVAQELWRENWCTSVIFLAPQPLLNSFLAAAFPCFRGEHKIYLFAHVEVTIDGGRARAGERSSLENEEGLVGEEELAEEAAR
jgi:hypothetical protein